MEKRKKKLREEKKESYGEEEEMKGEKCEMVASEDLNRPQVNGHYRISSGFSVQKPIPIMSN